MWWQVVLQVSWLLLVAGMQIVHDPLDGITNRDGVNCIDYTTERFAKMFNEGWRSRSPLLNKRTKRSSPALPAQFTLSTKPMSSRMDSFSIIDNLIPRGDYLVKEHAKLVHDINSLRQVVFVKPLAEENKDYEDSILHEIIETSTTPAPWLASSRPFSSSTRPPTTSTKKSSIPIILVGGASHRQVIKSQPITFAKPTVSLIGTTMSPIVKHPYPFVVHRKPVKICVTGLPPVPTQAITKTIWERILDYFLPRRSFGR